MASTTPPAADVPAAGGAATMEAGKQASAAEIGGIAPSKAAAAAAGGGAGEKAGPSATNGPSAAPAAASMAPAAAAAAAPVAPVILKAAGAAAAAGSPKLIPPPLGGVPARAAAAIQTDPTERRLDDAAVVQVEWYLGQVNLMNDYYLKSKMDSGYWVQLDVLLSFPKMQRLGRTDVAAFAALLRERSASVVVDPSGTRVRPAFAAAAEAAAPSTLVLTELPSPPVSAEFITTALTAADATIPTPLSVRSEPGDSWSITWAAPNGASRAAAALEGTTICGRAVRSSIKPVELLPPPPVLPASPAGGSPAVYGNRGVPWNPGMDSGSPVYPGNMQPHMLVRPPYGYALHPQPGSPYTPTAGGSFQPSPHPSPVSDGSYVPPPPPPPAYYAQYNMYPGHPGFDLSIGASAAGAVGATSPGLPNGAMLPGMPGVERFPGSHAGGSGVSRQGNKRNPRADGRSGNARTAAAASAPPQPGTQPSAGGATPFTPAGRAGARAPAGTHPSAGGENRRLGPSDAVSSSGSNKAATPAASSSSTTSASAASASSAGGRKVKKGGNRSNTHSGGSGGGPHSGNGNTGSSSTGSNRAAHAAGSSAGGNVAGGAGGANAGGKDVKDAPVPVRRSGSGNTNGPSEVPGTPRKADAAPLTGGKAAAAAEKKPAQASVNFTATHFPPLPGLSSEDGAVPAGAASEAASSRGAFAAAARRPSSAPPPTAAPVPRPSPPTPPLAKEVSAAQNPSDDDGASRSDRAAPAVVAAASPSSPSKSAPVSGAGMSYAAILRAKRPPSAPSSPKGVARPTKAGEAPSRTDLTAAASSPKVSGGSADGSGGSSASSAGPVLSSSLSASRHKAESDGAQQPRGGSAESAPAATAAARASDSGSTGTAAAAPLEPSAAAPKGGASSTPVAASDAGDAVVAKVEKSKAPSPAPRPSVWDNKPLSVLQAGAAPRPPPPPPRMAAKPAPPTLSREEVAVATKEPATTPVSESADQDDKAVKKEVDRPAPARSSSGSTPEAPSGALLPPVVSQPAAATNNVPISSTAAKSATPASPAAAPAMAAKAAPNADGIHAKGAWASGSLQHVLLSGSAASGDAAASADSKAEEKATDTGAAPKAAERKADPPVAAE